MQTVTIGEFLIPPEMIKNIIFLSEGDFSKRDYDRFGVELLKKNEFNVEVLEDKEKIYRKIKTAGKNDLFILVGFLDLKKHFGFYSKLSRSKADYAVMQTNAIPNPVGSSKIKGFLKKLLFHVFSFRLFGLKPAKFVIAGGKKSFSKVPPLGKSTEIIWTHTMDYDIYFGSKGKSKKRRVAVFLDEYQPFHPDWQMWGYKTNPLNPDKYYLWLNKIFEKIENELGFEVVIAAHPKSEYEKHKDYFRGRKVIKGKTKELVREASLILTHSSTSNNYSVLYKKPIIFMTDKISEKVTQAGGLINMMSREFGKKPIFIDGEYKINWGKEMKVNNESYERYRENFIKKSGTPEKLLWQIVADRLKKV